MSGAAWLRVTSSGAVRGTPISDLANLTSTAVVEATNSAGDTVQSTIVVPIRGTRAELVPDPKVMTMNMRFGGRNVSDYREKQLRFLLNQNVDVVTVQESYGTSAKELGEALGWDYYQAGYDLGIISRYPIVHRSPLPEDSGLSAMRPQLRRSSDTPVLLTGYFNAASHQDWSHRTNRCGYRDGVPWPTSVKPAEAGLVDTYRQVHRNPLTAPGITWSPIYETFSGGYGYDDHTGEPEPHDRIDFVFAKGNWRAKGSEAVVAGTPTAIPNQQDNEWTSDHAAVITTFHVS